MRAKKRVVARVEPRPDVAAFVQPPYTEETLITAKVANRHCSLIRVGARLLGLDDGAQNHKLPVCP